MATVHIICGGTGAGKTTYAYDLATRTGAVRFSIDPWMHELFGPDGADGAGVSFEWRMERIARCETRIWTIAEQLLSIDVDVVLDLGFTLRAHRDKHRGWALSRQAEVVVHLIDTPAADRRARIQLRNRERDPRVYSFKVTEQMFDFMEGRFEPPDEAELARSSDREEK